MKHILLQTSGRKIRKALNTIPEGLHDIYRQAIEVIHRLGGDRTKLALDVLAWVSSAARPLDPRELQEAVALEEDDTTIEPDFLTDESTLIDICGGLVSIDENSRTVRFVHYSVQEYFENNPGVLSGAHTMIALTCLTHLSLDCFAEAPDEMDWLSSRVKENALYDYAARNWGYHTSFVGKDTRVLEKLLTFSNSGPRVETAIHLFLLPTEEIGWWNYFVQGC